MKEKNRPQPVGVDPGTDDETPTYEIDAETPEVAAPETGESGEEEAGDEAGAPAPEEDENEETPARSRSRFSRREILDRFQKKNTAIAELAREKVALEKSRAELEAQVSDYKDRWLRAAAEFENYRKRSTKEWELLKQQSRTEVVLEVLSSLDDFERAFAVVEDEDESEFVRGIRLIYNNLLAALQKLGVAEIDAHHQPFDPARHMAVGQIETTEAESGQVAQVVARGYSMDGVVIRPARVIVAK